MKETISLVNIKPGAFRCTVYYSKSIISVIISLPSKQYTMIREHKIYYRTHTCNYMPFGPVLKITGTSK